MEEKNASAEASTETEEPKRTQLETELEAIGIKIKVSEENADKQWKTFAREYRITGVKAYSFLSEGLEIKTAIMCGDVEILEDGKGVSIIQTIRRPQADCPKKLTYAPPGVMQIAGQGTDTVTLSQKWTRIAAMCSGHNEGEFARWLYGRDRSLMETIAQLFSQV